MPRQKSRSRVIHLRDVQQPHRGFQADFDVVYTALKTQIGGNPDVSETSIVPLIMTCIRLVQQVAKTSRDGGSAKKQLVMALITALIQDSGLGEQEKILIQQTVEIMGPSIIDGLIDADHGKLLAHGFGKIKAICCK